MEKQEKTRVQSIKIENLFEIFNYEIEYPKGENVLILTGGNGFGKTQVLNILYNLFNRKLGFFQKLSFDKITVCLSNNLSIEIEKKEIKNKKDVNFTFFDKKKEIKSFSYEEFNRKIIDFFKKHFPLSNNGRKITSDSWIDKASNEILTVEGMMETYKNLQLSNDIGLGFTKNISKEGLKFYGKKIVTFFTVFDVRLIAEQRLLKRVNDNTLEDNQVIMTESIHSYSDELRDLISELTKKSFEITQKLDSTYLTRLVSEGKKITKQEYELRFNDLKSKQDKLIKNGLYENSQEVPEFSKNDAKALLVYLNDLEEKLAVFDNLLEKLELFTTILNERRFTYKSIKISREKGFYFETSNGKKLELTQLSSGEQHEVVLLYELIFKTNSNMLVLIDEPEISLHVSWQRDFLNDLLKIIEIQNFQVLIATHSPSIINDRWDLVYNLEKKEEAK